MKIHFFGSLTGNQMKVGDITNYQRIVSAIEDLGYEIITKHSIDKKLEEVKHETIEQHQVYVKNMMKWMKMADIIVCEVTKPEIGTGFELAVALNMGKPIIALYTDGQDTPILAGSLSDKIQHVEYDVDNLKQTLRMSLDEAKDQADVRFNFFVSPQIVNYLDWIAKQKKMPRAVYLRRLIEKDMDKNKDFEKEE